MADNIMIVIHIHPNWKLEFSETLPEAKYEIVKILCNKIALNQ